MTRTRRIAVDQTDGVPFADIGLTWIMPDGSAGRVAYDLVAGTNDTPDARTIYFPIAYGGAAYTSIALWGNGFASFGPVTVAQTNFMASGQAFSNPLGFPGDFVARPISGSAGTICAYEGIIDRTGPAPFAIEEAIDFLNLSWYTNVLESFEIQNPAGPIIQLTNDFASLPPGTFYRLGGVAGQNQGTVALVIASSGTTASGSAGNDVIKGFAGGDVIDGGNGADTLNGYGGNDRISGGNDNDMLIGGDGNDLLLPGAGADSVFGGNGIDTVSYATDNIRVQVNLSTGQGAAGAVGDSYVGVENAIGGILSDSLIGSEVSNLLDGGADDDELLGFGGDDLLLPGSGTDTVIGGTGIDTVSYANDNIRVQVNLSTGQGSAGAAGDTYAEIENVVGGILSDSLIGNAFDNRLEGGGDNDELLGFDGNDTLIGGAGADALTGGAGSDTASYAGDDGAVFVNLTLGQGFGNAAQGDTLAQIENLVGAESGDFFIGDAQINRLDGGPGNDVLIGALAGDVLIGGTGSDFASYEDNYGGVFINFLTGQGFGNAAQGDTYQGIENLRGSVFDDFFIGNDAVNILEGNAGNDVLIGALGGDVLVGGAGSDWASYEENYGAVFVNLSVGLGFGNAAQGDSYQEIENLRGGVFFDTLIGDTGANTLDGGRGNDTLTGAAGADVFAFTTALDGVINVDTITDMAAGSDKISLSASVFGAVGATGPLASSAFVVGANATTADHRIIYHSATGNLFYDADGSGAGAAVLFAKVVPGIALTAADFLIG